MRIISATPLDLSDFGCSESISTSFASATSHLRGGPFQLGRLTRVERGFSHVATEDGEALTHIPKSLAKGDIDNPVTGDWVVVDTSKQAVVTILPRYSACVRRAVGKKTEGQTVVANVDIIFVVMGLDEDFNLRRLERYLTLVFESRAEPVVLLTKAGLCAAGADLEQQARGVAPNVACHRMDVKSGFNPDAPREHLRRGVSAAFLGSSGAGKSTLTNALMGRVVAETRSVRARDGRGKHTTSRREMFLLEGGGVIIDTPGLRELALFAEPESLDRTFEDISNLAALCQFSNCRHETEPACAVLAGLRSGEVDPVRLTAFRKLSMELGRGERRFGPPSSNRRKR